MWPPHFEPCHDLTLAQWIKPRLLPWGAGMGTHVTSIIAVGFEDSGFAPGTDALSGTIENMHQRRLALRQRVVLVVALGAVLWVFGDWVIEQSSPGIGTGWTSYAPLSVFSGIELHPWAQAVLWLGLIVVWTIAALLILRESKPKVEAPAVDHLGDDPTTPP